MDGLWMVYGCFLDGVWLGFWMLLAAFHVFRMPLQKYLEMKIVKGSKQEIWETRQRFFTKQNRDVHRICGGLHVGLSQKIGYPSTPKFDL